MGSPQFIASSYRKYAVDADGDGRRDLWSSWDDVIASVANYLRAYGWRSGEQVVVDGDAAGSRTSVASRPSKIELNESVQSLRDKGVRFETALPAMRRRCSSSPQGKDGPGVPRRLQQLLCHHPLQPQQHVCDGGP